MALRLPALLDDALDRTVVFGYGRTGFRLRHRSWSRLPPDALRGRTAVITGANSGIGKAIAAGLTGLGATVTLLVRDESRGAVAAEQIAAVTAGVAPEVRRCDICDLADIRRFASGFVGRAERLDVLVHNAGVLPAARGESPQGHEICLATHVLGPLLLTELLAPAMARAASGRVILVSSGGMYTQALPDGDFEYRTGEYRGATAYARTKRMQVALTPILSDRYAAQGIAVHCMHPGWVDTPGVATSLPRFRALARPLLRTPAQGADTAVWLAATDVVSGRFWHDRRARTVHYLRRTVESAAAAEQVWRYCAAAAGISDA